MERTLVIIKPDAVERGLVGRIISRFEDKYFRIVSILMVQKDEKWVREMYPHLSDYILKDMIEFMTAAPIIGLIVVGNNVVSMVRSMVGPTFDALPGTIRGDFGTYPIRFNCVHASDSIDNAEREIKLFYDT
jgi:nucleoside-diphosphate kinase